MGIEEIRELRKIEYHSEFVLTTKQIADFYGCTVNNIRWNFAKNQDKFIEGVHYFKIEGAALKEFKAYFTKLEAQSGESENFRPADLPFSKLASSLYLWTLQGAARHCKILGTKKAWEVFNELEKNYFGAVETKNCVYAMELDEGTVKIGRTSNIEKRVKQIEAENNCHVLRVFNTAPLPLETAVQMETACLETFAAFLSHDNEYFKIDFEDARAEIKKLVGIDSAAPLPINTYCELKFLIEKTTDDNLRDELIKAAAKILLRNC